MRRITVLPRNRILEVANGTNLLSALREAGLAPDAPCGGDGRCGKCRVTVDGREVLSCQTVVDRNMTVVLPAPAQEQILTRGIVPVQDGGTYRENKSLAFDIGTTTVAGYLIVEKTGKILAAASAPNPQRAFGADVVSRIRLACDGHMEELTTIIRDCIAKLTLELCEKAACVPAEIGVVSVVGNPVMQQLFFGISVDNLARPPFAPVLTGAETLPASEYIPMLSNASLLVIPNVAGFVGADTVACVMATEMDRREELTLLVDIGTNGEMVLGNRDRLVACATAAGPALEGANISCGMTARPGAIDRVLPDGSVQVIGGREAEGLCGSGLIDAIAVTLEQEKLNSRGKILKGDELTLAERVVLTQEDIRQFQLAKGAIFAGISLLCAHIGAKTEDIARVFLAGAFGSFLNPASACRVGLLPPELEEKITAIGNAAGSGAVLLARQEGELRRSEKIARQMTYLDLSTHKDFPKAFARGMTFLEKSDPKYWANIARKRGFFAAFPVEINTLIPREDVRAMCAADKCGAYGKNWTCPPYCGTLADCTEKMQSYRRGILLQTVGKLEKTVDTKGYCRTEEKHLSQLHTLYEELQKTYPDALCLGSGGCRVCKTCAYPEPCRFPEKAISSMEAYGLFVTQVCRDNGVQYYHGEKTVTYTACILY